jgi:DNA-binding transcriptional LysR family regulator
MKTANDLILFYHVANQGSFTKAADLVGLGRTVVSRRISQLEKEFGAQLLNRTTRALTLTEAGETCFSHARSIYDSAIHALEAMNDIGERLTGVIRLTVPTVSGELILPEAVASFSVQYPDIHIEMDLDNRFIDLVKEGYDFAVRTGTMPNSSNKARRLIDVHWVICAAPSYLNQHGIPVTADELLNHNCLCYTYQETGANEWLVKNDSGVYTIEVKGNLTTNNASALRKAARCGQGLVYVPKILVADDLAKGQLIEVLHDQAAKKLGLYAVYPFTKYQPIKVKLFIEHLYQCYQSQIERF